ncbi:hypothetical protein M501DRAFT_1035067 [Patellaria atrata CBS 101060]|uniref:Uncharacterized protein n=1 Tax=Patellaria atrata CBS 101060 TaxID=1346257 RepID=A0A9P4S223_9PEZI|nr:hypothetical protein M501DRAFT_1035067 [Patellaria atrata CBS 101060]
MEYFGTVANAKKEWQLGPSLPAQTPAFKGLFQWARFKVINIFELARCAGCSDDGLRCEITSGTLYTKKGAEPGYNTEFYLLPESHHNQLVALRLKANEICEDKPSKQAPWVSKYRKDYMEYVALTNCNLGAVAFAEVAEMGANRSRDLYRHEDKKSVNTSEKGAILFS